MTAKLEARDAQHPTSQATRLRCAYCGKKLPAPRPGGGPRGVPRKYCHTQCRQKMASVLWYAKQGRKPGDPLPEIKCPECGGMFTPHSGRHKYCHPKCQMKVRRRRERKRPQPAAKVKKLRCLLCDAEFTPRGCRQLFCTPSCQQKAARSGHHGRLRQLLVRRVKETVSCAAIKAAAEPLGLAEPEVEIPTMVGRLDTKTLKRLIGEAKRAPFAVLDTPGDVA